MGVMNYLLTGMILQIYDPNNQVFLCCSGKPWTDPASVEENVIISCQGRYSWGFVGNTFELESNSQETCDKESKNNKCVDTLYVSNRTIYYRISI